MALSAIEGSALVTRADLAGSEEAEALRSGEHRQARDRHDLVGEWNRRRDGQTEREIGADPNDGKDGHRHGGEGERDLLQAKLFVVRRVEAQEYESLEIPAARRCCGDSY
jgi:hypothetical protein